MSQEDSKPKLSIPEPSELTPIKLPRKLVFRNRRPQRAPDLETIHRRLLVALDRESQHLMVGAIDKLTKEQSFALHNYLRLMRELRKGEKAEGQHLSEEELVAAVAAGEGRKP
jgi:hypothetical protein